MTGASAPTWNIFDGVPGLTVFPYVYVGDQIGSIGTALTMGTKATDIRMTLHIFSQYPGWKEVQGIVDAIDALLNEHTLALTGGFTHFFTLFDNYMPVVEKDGLTRHGALRYLLKTQG